MSAVLRTHRTGGVGTYHYMENQHKNSIRSDNFSKLHIYIESLRSLCSTSPLKFEVKLGPKPKVNVTWWPVLLTYDIITQHLMIREFGKKKKRKQHESSGKTAIFFFLSSKQSHNSLKVNLMKFFFLTVCCCNTHRLCWAASVVWLERHAGRL